VPDALTATTSEDAASAEMTVIPERVVVAPCAGRFVPLPPEVFTSEGEWVEPGQAVGEVHNGGGRMQVRSPFRGWVMGMIALPGQPVRAGEALFWVRSC
jgi:biotin carboxyl carrier protein